MFNELTSDPSRVANAKTGINIPACTETYADCVVSDVTGEQVLLQVDDTCEVQTSSLLKSSEIVVKDSGYTYPLGLLDFTLDCGAVGYTTTVTQYYYGSTSKQYELRKYNDNTGKFSGVKDYTIEEVDIDGRVALRVVYTVTDGGELDTDGVANGIIVDPVGLAIVSQLANGSNSVPNVGVPNTGLGKQSILPYAGAAIAGVLVLAVATSAPLRKRAYELLGSR